jgi:hypothetical protein
VLENFCQKKGGSYRIVLAPETRALKPYEQWSGVAASGLGYDLENASTIVSFGAPMLDGWGTPGTFTRLWADRAAGVTDPQLKLVQVEANLSRTAARAWQWVPIPAGAEAALAAGIARVLLEEHLVSARGPMPPLTLPEAAVQTGLATDAIRNLAHTIVARTPAVAIAADNNPAIAALNIVLGSVGARGGIVQRSKRNQPYLSADTAIPLARAVLIDSSVPWDFVPQTDAEVFRFAAWDGGSNRTDWLLPAPGFLEELSDIPSAPAAAIETYAVVPAVTKAPHEVQSAVQFICSYDPASAKVDTVIHTRCQELFRGRTGLLTGQGDASITTMASAQVLEDRLLTGSVWVGDRSTKTTFKCDLKEWPSSSSSPHRENWASAWPVPALPPLATKLYRESTLREASEMRNA